MVNLGSERLFWPSLPFPFLLHGSRRWCTGASEDIARLSRDDSLSTPRAICILLHHTPTVIHNDRRTAALLSLRTDE